MALNNWLKQNFDASVASTTTTKKEYKGCFRNYGSIFILLGEREKLENFPDFNKESGGRGSKFWKNVKNSV